MHAALPYLCPSNYPTLATPLLQTLPPRADTESNRHCGTECGWLAKLAQTLPTPCKGLVSRGRTQPERILVGDLVWPHETSKGSGPRLTQHTTHSTILAS